jgi:acyl-CoA synthetase (AMP-forming)/AMP-acid ligase II
MSGYLDAPELNRAAFKEGWFRTGDIGSLDEDGFLFLHGRLSELINRGGEKIVPAEIESASAIAEAAAFAIPIRALARTSQPPSFPALARRRPLRSFASSCNASWLRSRFRAAF